MIACFLSNISAKYYKNPSMLSRVIAKNVGDVFLRHSVCTDRCKLRYWQWRRQDLLQGGSKLEIMSWSTHGVLQGRVQQLLDD